jgi:hypothetical protein
MHLAKVYVNFRLQLYISATTAIEITATLNKELQSISEWVTEIKSYIFQKLKALNLAQIID